MTGSFARTGLPLPVSTSAYNANNQLTQWGTAGLTYDANGNMLSDGTNSFTWDARNHLVSMNFGANAFQYDPFGRRVGKTSSGATTNFLHDGVNSVQEIAGGTPTANLTMGGIDEVFARTDAAGARNFLTDPLGSTIALTDSAGTTQAQYTYEPFGNTTGTGGSTNSYQYAGRENDGTGLYFYRARYYNPSLQRFISEDPIGFRGGINGYTYVGNSPPNFIDPLGLSAMAGRALCFTLGIRAPGQTFNQCMIQNSRNYSAGGFGDLSLQAVGVNSNVGTSTPGQFFAGNTFTGLYSALAGSAEDAVTTGASAAPGVIKGAMGSPLTYGRRTANIMSLNIAGKGGLPQAVSSASTGVKSSLGFIDKAFNLGLDASTKGAIDLGFFGAELIGCSMKR